LELLTTFRDMQDHLVSHRDRILEEMKHQGRLSWRPVLAPTATLSLECCERRTSTKWCSRIWR
jgi:hypothetical protein